MLKTPEQDGADALRGLGEPVTRSILCKTNSHYGAFILQIEDLTLIPTIKNYVDLVQQGSNID